jgi:hypothetical protein
MRKRIDGDGHISTNRRTIKRTDTPFVRVTSWLASVVRKSAFATMRM